MQINIILILIIYETFIFFIIYWKFYYVNIL